MRQCKVFCCILLVALCCRPAHADEVRLLAPGVWRIAGANAAISAENGAVIANTGVISTGAGAIVIDPGPSARHGVMLRAAIARLTPEPVRWVILSHAHPENVLAASAFPDAEVIASAPATALMASRCTVCLTRLTEQLGAAAMYGTRIHLPQRRVSNGEQLVLGKRTLRFLVFAHAHTPGDLAIVLPEAGILFAGGLANDARVPDMRDAALSGWIAALETLEQGRYASVMPGHGPGTEPGVLARFGAYLKDLRAACDADLARHGDAATSGARLSLPAYGSWVEYDTQHRFNVARAYREREDAQLMGQ